LPPFGRYRNDIAHEAQTSSSCRFFSFRKWTIQPMQSSTFRPNRHRAAIAPSSVKPGERALGARVGYYLVFIRQFVTADART